MPRFASLAALVCIILLSSQAGVQAQDTPPPMSPAVLAATQKIEKNPTDPKAYDARAALYFKQGNKIASLEDMKKAAELEPDEDQKVIRVMDIQQFMSKK